MRLSLSDTNFSSDLGIDAFRGSPNSDLGDLWSLLDANRSSDLGIDERLLAAEWITNFPPCFLSGVCPDSGVEFARETH